MTVLHKIVSAMIGMICRLSNAITNVDIRGLLFSSTDLTLPCRWSCKAEAYMATEDLCGHWSG